MCFHICINYTFPYPTKDQKVTSMFISQDEKRVFRFAWMNHCTVQYSFLLLHSMLREFWKHGPWANHEVHANRQAKNNRNCHDACVQCRRLTSLVNPSIQTKQFIIEDIHWDFSFQFIIEDIQQDFCTVDIWWENIHHILSKKNNDLYTFPWLTAIFSTLLIEWPPSVYSSCWLTIFRSSDAWPG